MSSYSSLKQIHAERTEINDNTRNQTHITNYTNKCAQEKEAVGQAPKGAKLWAAHSSPV